MMKQAFLFLALLASPLYARDCEPIPIQVGSGPDNRLPGRQLGRYGMGLFRSTVYRRRLLQRGRAPADRAGRRRRF